MIKSTEGLDHHRGRGQQHITIKHVTVNADQAVLAENVATGGTGPPGQCAGRDRAGVPARAASRGGERNKNDHEPHQSAYDAPRCKAKSKRTGELCRAPPVRGYRVCLCMELKVAHRRGTGTGIIDTVWAQRGGPGDQIHQLAVTLYAEVLRPRQQSRQQNGSLTPTLHGVGFPHCERPNRPDLATAYL